VLPKNVVICINWFRNSETGVILDWSRERESWMPLADDLRMGDSESTILSDLLQLLSV